MAMPRTPFVLSLAVLASLSSPAAPEASPIASRTATVDGLALHYLTAGHGPAVVLLHGYAETSRMWRPILPLLAERFTVMTENLVLMDAFLPGVAGWKEIYDDPGIWHFRFSGPTPEKLVAGRERIYLEHFWNDFAADPNHSIPEADRKAYTAAYSRPGRMRAGWAYFVSFQKAADDFARLSRTKLAMPVLSIGGDKANGRAPGEQVGLVATDAKVVVLKDCGHRVLEEKPKETTEALASFL